MGTRVLVTGGAGYIGSVLCSELLASGFEITVLDSLIFNQDYLEEPGRNLRDILRQTALLGIFALGAAIVIIAGGIDLSSGSTIVFSGSICGLVMLVLAPTEVTVCPTQPT